MNDESPPPIAHTNPLWDLRMDIMGALRALDRNPDLTGIAEFIINRLRTPLNQTPLIGNSQALSAFWSIEKIKEINDLLKSHDTAAPSISLEECVIAEELYAQKYEPSEVAAIITRMRELIILEEEKSGYGDKKVAAIFQDSERLSRHTRKKVTTFLIPREKNKK